MKNEKLTNAIAISSFFVGSVELKLLYSCNNSQFLILNSYFLCIFAHRKKSIYYGIENLF